ncbi:MAG: 2OG-Fe(II) oxygenase [Silicimonas sp.]|nr:2OG-Fe(II) oxygenase [Silicimonas sp.]
MDISEIVDMDRHPIDAAAYGDRAGARLNTDGVLVLDGFIRDRALSAMRREALAGQAGAYFCTQDHSVYLTPQNPDYPPNHPANRQVQSSKGCICDDQVAENSPLRVLYDAPVFREYVKRATGQSKLHPYADTLSSINIHYANRGQELGWHFDNSSFAITLLIQKAAAGSRFEYVKDLRDAEAGAMNFEGVEALLDGRTTPDVLEIEPGTLVLFRGRNSIHRVSPNQSDQTRILSVLAYNAEPGVELSESARMTFYGRLS